MKKYKTAKGWTVVPKQRLLTPELFISPEGIIYKRKTGRETVHVTVETKFGTAFLRRWTGSPAEKRATKLNSDITKLILRKASEDGRRKKSS